MHRIDLKNAAEVAKAVKAGAQGWPAKSLADALARVLAEVGSARPDEPAGAADVAAVRAALARHNVLVLPAAVELLAREVVHAGGGKMAHRFVVRTTARFVHGPSGDTLDVQVIGEGQDGGDRAASKALAGAMADALRQSFSLPPRDEPGPAADPGPVVPAGIRGFYAHEFGRCKTRADYLAVCQRVAEDVKVGVLAETDRDALKDVARDTSARLPVQPRQ